MSEVQDWHHFITESVNTEGRTFWKVELCDPEFGDRQICACGERDMAEGIVKALDDAWDRQFGRNVLISCDELESLRAQLAAAEQKGERMRESIMEVVSERFVADSGDIWLQGNQWLRTCDYPKFTAMAKEITSTPSDELTQEASR